MRYSDYVGHDSNSVFGTWPTSSGTMAEGGRAVPVYRGWPDRPYQVLGSVRLENPNQQWDEGDFAAAARQARSHKGDAIIIRHGSEFGVAQIAGMKNDQRSIYASSYTSALIIRWLTQDEIDDQQHAMDVLIQEYELRHPGANRDVAKLLYTYLVRTGVKRGTQDFSRHFDETLAKLSYSDPGNLAGDWLFKAVLSGGSAISGEDVSDYLGW